MITDRCPTRARREGGVFLVEEVPGVPEGEQFFIWEHRPFGAGRGMLWQGPSVEAGREWAEAEGVRIDYLERFEP